MQKQTGENPDIDLFERRWPVENPKATIVIVHGLGEHSGRYESLVKTLNQSGYAAASVDLPGHGKSAGKRGHIDDFIDYHAAILALTLDLHRQQPDTPVFILGHSLGGLIVSHMMHDHQELYEGILLSGASIQSPQQPPDWQIGITGLIAKIAPNLGMINLDINGLCRDQTVIEQYLQDPLVNRSKLTARFITEMFKAMQTTVDKASEIFKPILIMHGGDDIITDPAGSQMLFDKVSATDKTLKIYNGFYHEIFNEPEAAQVFADVVGWLDKHC